MATTTTQDGFTTVKTCITLFGVVSAIVLGTVAVMAFTGHETTPFMWIRGAVLLGAAPLIHRLVSRAAAGSAKAFDRVRTLVTITPIAIVGVDLIPGLCPAWYAVLQGLSALALVSAAVLAARTSPLSAAFPEEG
ncbi:MULTISPECIES: hypothetical protein [unclassified Kitasatospora]|uniref:hypothetical protein n=1 Tax=unclassified Kitasatospora TaxID=2633591 RepID=UPI0033D88349